MTVLLERRALPFLLFAALGLTQACGDEPEEVEATASETETETETESETEPEPEPPDGCGDGDVDDGEVCDDGGANCPEGWGLCLRCEHCAGWVVRARTELDPNHFQESALPQVPFCSRERTREGAAAPEQTERFVYDDHGRVTRHEHWLNGNSTYTYDDRGRRLRTETTFEGQLAYTLSNDYSSGNRVETRDQGGDGTADTVRTFEYDESGRVVRVAEDGTSPYVFEYDDLGRFIRVMQGSTAELVIGRDAAGRMTRYTPHEVRPRIHRYDPQGHLQVSMMDTSPGHPPTDRDNWFYDADGNMQRHEYWENPDTLGHRCAVTTDGDGRVTREACNEDDDEAAEFTIVTDYACLDALRESLPRTIAEE